MWLPLKDLTGLYPPCCSNEADKDALDLNGQAPLMWRASDGGHLPIVKTLLAADADVNVRNTTTTLLSLDYEAQEGNCDVNSIVGHWAAVNARRGNDWLCSWLDTNRFDRTAATDYS